MLRIECGCGKILKVADDAVGKKVKCPACGELTLVKKSAQSAVSAKPLPRTRPVEDDEDDDPRPRKKGKEAAKGGGGCLLWILLGGAAAAFFGLILVGGGVWFFFLRGDKPLTGPGSTLDPVAIKLFVPHKKGDKREIKINLEQKIESKNEGGDLGGKGQAVAVLVVLKNDAAVR